MNNIIEIKNISKRYYTKDKEIMAIEDVSFNVRKGEYIAIVGPSGCGKSTLLNIIGGIDIRSSGDIVIANGIKIGYMLQNDCLFSWLNILDNCLLGLRINKMLTKENLEYVKELIDSYGLHDFMYSYPSSLSGGMRQRVALIRTLALRPDILLLDEPFSALDYQTRLNVVNDVYKIIKDNKKTVIMITHDVEEACSVADRVIVLSDRPSVVKKIFKIDIGYNSTPLEKRKCPKFLEYCDMIWKEIDSNEK